jgi:hypothetical protein
MFKKFDELKKWEKASLIFGLTEVAVGVGMVIYGTIQERKILKEMKQNNLVDEIINDTNKILDELDEITKQNNIVDELVEQHLNVVEQIEKLHNEGK